MSNNISLWEIDQDITLLDLMKHTNNCIFSLFSGVWNLGILEEFLGACMT